MYRGSSSVLSAAFVVSLLVASSSSSYLFNGYRGVLPTTTAPTPIIYNGYNNNGYDKRPLFGVLDRGLVGKNQNGMYGEPTTTTTAASINDNNNYNKCVQKDDYDLRPFAGSCAKFQMCFGGVLKTYPCPAYTSFNPSRKQCVDQGTSLDTCRTDRRLVVGTTGERPVENSPMCPRGATYKKAHPTHCARYYDCGKSSMMSEWAAHEWECKYPFMFNDVTEKCENYSMVDCGNREVAYDKCDYRVNTCDGHAHCRPCSITYPSCKDFTDGMNVWKGKTPSPYYVVCKGRRVVYSGSCPGGQLFDGKTGTCVLFQDRSIYYG